MRPSLHATGIACAVSAALLATPGVASAEDGNTDTTIVTTTNPGFCFGSVSAGVGHYPSSAVLGLTGTLYGFGPCSVDVTFTFERQGDGLVQTYTRTLNGPGPVGTSKDVVSPGIGVWDVTITTNAASFGAEPMTIDIEEYQG